MAVSSATLTNALATVAAAVLLHCHNVQVPTLLITLVLGPSVRVKIGSWITASLAMKWLLPTSTTGKWKQ